MNGAASNRDSSVGCVLYLLEGGSLVEIVPFLFLLA